MAEQAVTLHRAGEGTENNAFGLPRVLLIRGGETGGAASQWIERVPAGHGPPLHIHRGERELFRVLSGRFHFWSDDDVLEVAAGDTLMVPPGTRHTFANVGEAEGQLLVTMVPGGFEEFFAAVEARGLTPDGGMAAILELADQYGMEIVGPPPLTRPAAAL